MSNSIAAKPSVLTLLLATLIALAASGNAFAREPEVYTGWSGLAVGGYDPVAYFETGEPEKGKKEYSTEYKGATWRFASQERLEMFLEDPETYAPKYGGYCAWAVAEGYLAKGNPKFWDIVDGALYLNFSGSVQKKWRADIPGFIAKADENWPGVLDK